MFGLNLGGVNSACIIFDWCGDIGGKFFTPDFPICNENSDVQIISKWEKMAFND